MFLEDGVSGVVPVDGIGILVTCIDRPSHKAKRSFEALALVSEDPLPMDCGGAAKLGTDRVTNLSCVIEGCLCLGVVVVGFGDVDSVYGNHLGLDALLKQRKGLKRILLFL